MKQMVLRKLVMSASILLGLCLFLLASGCDFSAKASRMVPMEFEAMNKHNSTVTVSESLGGIEAIPLGASQISNSAFTEALCNALVKSGIFQDVIKDGVADYILDVTIIHYNKPWGIGVFDISINTKWELTNAETLVPIWFDTFETSYRANFSEAIQTGKRLQKANEGAVRTNIKEGIRRLSLLSL